ncbi:MAG TPA: 16S rRNA (guanine(527)-N(7))-methyltransferase RsmG [Thermoanaerobaculia bacterium]|nr:16S rRNA (guanine(527)-N(7))-methyltransferase RsmG [Thermoanaerobaculia bacterium]
MREKLEIYKRELLRWNEKINLIGPEAREHLDEHIAEALQAAEILKPEGEVLDFGSGGGLPAIPMAIVSPAAHLHMVEADQKKWAFLKHIVRTCRLQAVLHGERLEDAIRRFPPDLRFTLVTSRAVGRPEEWLPLIEPYLQGGGRVALFQGSAEAPGIDHLRRISAEKLTRGWLVTFHVEQR